MSKFLTGMTAAAMVLVAGCSPEIDEATNENASAESTATASLARIDCGEITVADLSVFSTAGNYKGVKKTLTDSCYLIRHGDDLMLWDTGLPAQIAGKGAQTDGGFTMTLASTIDDQLRAAKINPADIDIIGISHFHDDHTGQMAGFPKAKLLTGKGDWSLVTAPNPDAGMNIAPYSPWAKQGGTVEAVSGDHDVFGDGSVVMLDLPGHTPGHTALQVMTDKGPVLLTGDLTHFNENYANDGIPTWNTDPQDSLASIQRFKKLAKDTNATVVIQHEPADIGKVPALTAATE